MKNTGIVRPIDELGRIVLPIELRRSLHIETGDGFEIHLMGDQIILNKHVDICNHCDSGRVNPDGAAYCKHCGRRMIKGA